MSSTKTGTHLNIYTFFIFCIYCSQGFCWERSALRPQSRKSEISPCERNSKTGQTVTTEHIRQNVPLYFLLCYFISRSPVPLREIEHLSYFSNSFRRRKTDEIFWKVWKILRWCSRFLLSLATNKTQTDIFSTSYLFSLFYPSVSNHSLVLCVCVLMSIFDVPTCVCLSVRVLTSAYIYLCLCTTRCVQEDLHIDVCKCLLCLYKNIPTTSGAPFTATQISLFFNSMNLSIYKSSCVFAAVPKF